MSLSVDFNCTCACKVCVFTVKLAYSSFNWFVPLYVFKNWTCNSHLGGVLCQVKHRITDKYAESQSLFQRREKGNICTSHKYRECYADFSTDRKTLDKDEKIVVTSKSPEGAKHKRPKSKVDWQRGAPHHESYFENKQISCRNEWTFQYN